MRTVEEAAEKGAVMTTFRKLQQNLEQLVDKLAKYSGLEKQLVGNIVYYTRCLLYPGSTEIDDLIFKAQMSEHFKITSSYMLDVMFHSLTIGKRRRMTVENYCKCICTFLSTKLDNKIDLVFRFYDANHDGYLSFYELFTLLKPCIVSSNEDDDTEASTKELVHIVMNLIDIDKNGLIDISEFRKLCKKDILYLQILGKCLPTDDRVEKFISKIENKTPHEIQTMFANERRRSLQELEPPVETTGLYPFSLDLP